MGGREIDTALSRLAPRIPRFERGCVLDHAADSTTLKHATPEEAAWLSLVAYVRHTFTDYDALLDEGYDREAARHAVHNEMADLLRSWGVKRPL